MIAADRQKYKMIALLMATLGAGLPMWTRPLSEIDFTNLSFLGLWLLIGIAVSFISLFFISINRRDMISSFTIGYVLAVVLHFVGGVIVSNYIHSQLSLALLIAMGIGIISGYTGSVIWAWIRLKGRKKKK